MEETRLTEDLSGLLLQAWQMVQTYAELMLVPGWRQYQVGIILGLAVLAFCLRLLVAPRLEAWSRQRQGWPKWRLRVLVQVRQRLGLILFAVLTWVVYEAMQLLTWPSRSYLIGIAATVATVWLAVAFVTRPVRNPLLRRLITWGLWIYGTLYALDLTDDVAETLAGISISIGEVEITALTLVEGLILIVVMLALARLVTSNAGRALNRNENMSPSMRVLATKTVQVIVYGIVFLMGIRALGIDLTGLAILSGAIGVGIGFGLQKVVSNLVSGIIILLDKSIKPGDVISLGETFGWIDSLGARYVSVVTRDGREYLIPNEDLITGQVVNWSHSDKFVRLDIFFGTSYGDNPHKVRKVAVEASEAVPRVLSHHKRPVCHVVGFGDSSVDYILRFWISDPSGGLTNIKGQIYLALWDAFEANDISFPFPQREVKLLEGSVLENRSPP